MKNILFKNGLVINEGVSTYLDVFVKKDRIESISQSIHPQGNVEVVDLSGKWLMPGIIDDQVHFREPGLTHKATIASESAAAVAGGVTTFMEMPNTSPPAVTQELLADKYNIAAQSSYANYSFYMGASNNNLEEVLRTDPKDVCGIKAFMGSSTGNMLVDDPLVLEELFSQCPMLIATHCEDEFTIKRNIEHFMLQYGKDAHTNIHPLVRSHEACLLSSAFAVNLAKKHRTRLHVLHISTADEVSLFQPGMLSDKHITAEVCVHHLTFSDKDYESLGNLIKCNPAIKQEEDRVALWKALLEDRFDVIATDHAPHTFEEKSQNYFDAPSGLPLIQHSLLIMLKHMFDGRITREQITDKMCHAPAQLFQIKDRGYIREGYFADLVIVDPDKSAEITKDNILYKCGWSPLEGMFMRGAIASTYINGQLAWNGSSVLPVRGQRIYFDI